jgi:hypothetical protein
VKKSRNGQPQLSAKIIIPSRMIGSMIMRTVVALICLPCMCFITFLLFCNVVERSISGSLRGWNNMGIASTYHRCYGRRSLTAPTVLRLPNETALNDTPLCLLRA